ncbi:glycoprotein-N-acetylgalactosamine 3-beta-galactosyltransferase 1-like [Brevipalpus obovatus]|uniref:glycoprotein-N-acetylgalactosamine 3-beta-galactosyltransferase 1-like n=1 Tax=Brevipalpus obovatus TaxID=246614 RepID=UPI003D9F6966
MNFGDKLGQSKMIARLQKSTVIISFLIGIMAAIIWKVNREASDSWYLVQYQSGQQQQQQHQTSEEILGPNSRMGISLDYNSPDSVGSKNMSADEIKRKIAFTSVFCVIISKSFKSSFAVKQTWSKNCDYIRFYGSLNDSSIPITHITRSNVLSFRDFCHVIFDLDQLMNDKPFDWILMTPDDTYVIVDNLRRLLAQFDANEPSYLGRPVRSYSILPYNAKNSGFVISNQAFKFVRQTVVDQKTCSSMNYPGIGSVDRRFEVALATILSKTNCTPIDTRDEFGRGRFLALNPSKHLSPSSYPALTPFWRNEIYHLSQGTSCCSPSAISLPDLIPHHIYLVHYLLNNVTVVNNRFQHMSKDSVS